MANCRSLLLVVLATTIVPPISAETHCPGNVASVPLRSVNRYQLLVTVSVNYAGPYTFLLDTGTQVTIVDPSVAADLHLSTHGTAELAGVGLHESASMATLDLIGVGSNTVANLRVVVSGLQKLKTGGLNVQGILGEDFLDQFDMLIDNAHGMLCLDESAMMRREIKGQPVPLSDFTSTTDPTSRGKSLIMTTRFFNGKRPIRLKIDSGSNVAFLYSPSDCLALGIIEGASWHGRGAVGEQQAFVDLPAQDFKIANLVMSKVPFLSLRNEHKDSLTGSYDGLLPTGLFKRVFVSRNGEFTVLEPR